MSVKTSYKSFYGNPTSTISFRKVLVFLRFSCWKHLVLRSVFCHSFSGWDEKGNKGFCIESLSLVFILIATFIATFSFAIGWKIGRNFTDSWLGRSISRPGYAQWVEIFDSEIWLFHFIHCQLGSEWRKKSLWQSIENHPIKYAALVSFPVLLLANSELGGKRSEYNDESGLRRERENNDLFITEPFFLHSFCLGCRCFANVCKLVLHNRMTRRSIQLHQEQRQKCW